MKIPDWKAESAMKKSPTAPYEREELVGYTVDTFERIFRWLTPIVIGTLALNLARSFSYGGSWSSILQNIFILAALLTLAIRRKFSPRFRVTVYSIACLTAGLIGVYQWGMM